MKSKTIIYETLGYLLMVGGIFVFFGGDGAKGAAVVEIMIGQLLLWRERIAENQRPMPIKKTDWKVLYCFGVILFIFAIISCSKSDGTLATRIERYKGFGWFVSGIYLIISGFIRYKKSIK